MLSFNILVLVATLYVSFLFIVAFFADRNARRGNTGWLNSPFVYTLSLSIYTTAWTFYGAVGSAARNGLEFLAIYLGPTLVFVGWWWFLRKLVRIGRTHRITSIADLLSSRYGKSAGLAVIVTILAVAGTTPYIALQLQSVALSFSVFAEASAPGSAPTLTVMAFWVAAGLAVFTILFGTRNLDSNEQHHGVVMAIAVEAIVKLVALLSVGIFVVWFVAEGPIDILGRIEDTQIDVTSAKGSRWVTLLMLSAAAIICLPRMFQVTVVENSDERHLKTASWAFPLYLFLMSLFVLPIAVMGLAEMPAGANPDLFVLTLPILHDQNGLAILVFLGGFSSATSMVIVATIALATMVSNHIVMPIFLYRNAEKVPLSGDVRRVLIQSRRLSIVAVLTFGYFYFRVTGGTSALASIGLIAFTGVAQVVPAMVGGLFWRGATRKGALAGLIAGFFLWIYTLFLPSFEGAWLMGPEVLTNGPFGIGLLRPQALMGMVGMDPLVHALLWSMSVNAILFVVISLLTFPSPLERLQAAQFVNVLELSSAQTPRVSIALATEDLLVMAQRVMGNHAAVSLFQKAAAKQGRNNRMPEPTNEFVDHLERELAGSVGAATAHAMIGQITGGARVSVEDLIAVADETAQIMEQSVQLEAKSRELAKTATLLRDANTKLTEISVQKDGFLSQISHELRTPMTSIRSFAEILLSSENLKPEDVQKFSSIIHAESMRLTRLLDELLDLSFLESGHAALQIETGELGPLLDRSLTTGLSTSGAQTLKVLRDETREKVKIATDHDRLGQVFINLISNAQKYCDADDPELTIDVRHDANTVTIDLINNGSGIPEDQREIIFEKFSRLSDASSAGSAGLGLAICREIMRNLGGTIVYLPGRGGAAFRVQLPKS